MARIGRILGCGINAAVAVALLCAAPALALPIEDPDSIVTEEEESVILLNALPLMADASEDLTSRDYAFFGELRTASDATLESAIERAAKQVTLRDLARTYVNADAAPTAHARLRPTIGPDEDWTGDNLGVADIILNSEALGGLARALVGEGEGEPGRRTFGLFGYELAVGVAGGGNVDVYEFTTNSGFSLSGEAETPAVAAPRADRSRVNDAQLIAAALEFFQRPIGLTMLVLVGAFLFFRLAVSIAVAVQHIRA